MEIASNLKKYWIGISCLTIGLVLIVIGLGLSLTSENKSQGVIIEEAASVESDKEKHVVVDVAGAVEKPGVYRLPYDARVQEALIAAGGLNPKADRLYVSKNINLAIKVSDGTKIYVPTEGESINSNLGNGGIVAGAAREFININSAGQTELESLPGVGPVIASKIIGNRPYSTLEDLLTKKVVGQKLFERIKKDITVY